MGNASNLSRDSSLSYCPIGRPVDPAHEVLVGGVGGVVHETDAHPVQADVRRVPVARVPVEHDLRVRLLREDEGAVADHRGGLVPARPTRRGTGAGERRRCGRAASGSGRRASPAPPRAAVSETARTPTLFGSRARPLRYARAPSITSKRKEYSALLSGSQHPQPRSHEIPRPHRVAVGVGGIGAQGEPPDPALVAGLPASPPLRRRARARRDRSRAAPRTAP